MKRSRASRREAMGQRIGGAAQAMLGLALASCATGAEPRQTPTEETVAAQTALTVNPDVPSILRDVAIHRAGEPVSPTLPNLISTSNDNRLVIAQRNFRLNAPEKLTKHLWDHPGGEPMAAGALTYQGALYDAPSGIPGGSAICDGTRQQGAANAENQPHACGADDCYDLTIVTPVFTTVGTVTSMTLWGAPVTVQVTQPKTASARIVAVRSHGPLVKGTSFAGIDSFFEPQITGDGRLLVGRVGGAMRDETTGDRINIVYAPPDTTVAPCDVRAWKELRAMSHAPYDPRVNSRYGFARYPFRDAEGTPIPDGRELRMTYPWIDREGRNLFVKTGNRPLYFARDGVPASAFGTRCVAGTACTDASPAKGITEEVDGSPNGFAVMGLWTHGRMVMVDGRLNNVDFGLGIDDVYHREVNLYGTATTNRGWIRVGTGRKLEELGDHGGNTGHIQSIENAFNFDPHFTPRSPRDVVWLMSTMLTTDEVVFDDWIDPHALIVSDMMPAWSLDDGTGKKAYRDGFTANAGFDGQAPLRLQNAATATTEVLRIPSYGRVDGPARAEPVALGGIHGRGLWMTGTTSVTYEIPAQTRALDEVWFTSMFIDARIPDGPGERRLFSFPDGASVVVVGRSELSFRDIGGSVLAAVTLPAALSLGGGGYHHLGLRRVGTKLDVLVDGFLLATASVGRAFRFPAGTFVVGKRSAEDPLPSVRGWIDELRVLNEEVGPELACNHARGSIVALGAGAPPELTTLAGLYPDSSHGAIRRALRDSAIPTSGRFACRHDYSVDTTQTSFTSLPAGVTSARMALLAPEATLVFDAPRPDTSANAFCLTCHIDGQPESLSVAALVSRPLPMQNDPRRQPLQAPRRFYGWFPADYLAPGVPPRDIENPDGVVLDRWLSPPAP